MIATIRADGRSRTYERDGALVERVRGLARQRRAVDIELAKALLRVDETKACYELACGSVAMFGRKLGLTAFELAAFETVRLVKLARAMEADASVEDRVRSGALSVPAAAELAGVLRHPACVPEDESAERSRWLDEAERATYGETRRRARRHMAELRCGEPIERLEVMAPDSVMERFERARVLASRKANRRLTRDQTFEVVVDAYVDANDPLEVDERARRVGPTSELPDSRYIPVSVRRAVRRRASDCCEFPDCDERSVLEFAHRRPHWAGGCREAGNLLLLCRFHHVLQEARFLVPVGPLDGRQNGRRNGRHDRTGDRAGDGPLWFRGEIAVCSREEPDERPPQGRRELRVAAVLAQMRQAGAWDHIDGRRLDGRRLDGRRLDGRRLDGRRLDGRRLAGYRNASGPESPETTVCRGTPGSRSNPVEGRGYADEPHPRSTGIPTGSPTGLDRPDG